GSDQKIGNAGDFPLLNLTPEQGLARHAAETAGRLTLTVLHGQKCFGVEVRRHQPRNARTHRAKAVGPEEAPVDERLVDEIPRMRMLRVQPSELGEELPRFDLQSLREGAGRGVNLFELDRRLAFGSDLKNDIRLTSQVRIDGAFENRFDILDGKATLRRIVSAHLQRLNVFGGRGAGRDETIEGEIEKVFSSRTRHD